MATSGTSTGVPLPWASRLVFFFAFWPVPSQTLLAALGALLLRANLPVSIIFVWVSNPLTYLPLFGGAYLMGGYLLGIDTQLPQQLSLEALSKEVGQLWLGCMVLGVLSAASGWLLVRGYWYWHVHSSWHERRRLRKQQIDVNQSVRHP